MLIKEAPPFLRKLIKLAKLIAKYISLVRVTRMIPLASGDDVII
jgi:hypothetical protein